MPCHMAVICQLLMAHIHLNYYYTIQVSQLIWIMITQAQVHMLLDLILQLYMQWRIFFYIVIKYIRYG